jgi:PH (Pleckstrin Homology) domain-containing protein
VTTFPLAPMNGPMRALTGMLLVVSVVLGGVGLVVPLVRVPMLVIALTTLALYPIVWLGCRPTRFEIDADALRIVWPIRTRTISRHAVRGARIVDARAFRQEHGRAMRIGVGGLFGAFGLLKTRTATFSMWVSRSEGLVLVTLADARPLLVTPDDPERFVAALLA